MQVVDRTFIPSPAEKVSMEPKKIKAQPVYKADKVELSKNIQKFDKPKVILQDPFNYNTISLKKEEQIIPAASELITQPIYNKVGEMLGIDMVHDWNKNYDKVYKIVEIAKEKLDNTDIETVLPWLYKMSNAAPSLTNRKLDDLNIFLTMGKEPRQKTKVITKVVTKYIKPKNTVDNFVNNLMSLKI